MVSPLEAIVNDQVNLHMRYYWSQVKRPGQNEEFQ